MLSKQHNMNVSGQQAHSETPKMNTKNNWGDMESKNQKY